MNKLYILLAFMCSLTMLAQNSKSLDGDFTIKKSVGMYSTTEDFWRLYTI